MSNIRAESNFLIPFTKFENYLKKCTRVGEKTSTDVLPTAADVHVYRRRTQSRYFVDGLTVLSSCRSGGSFYAAPLLKFSPDRGV